MSTIETIGTGQDYATPQEWFDAHAIGGDITGDSDAPYIGELTAEVHPAVTFYNCVTDADHYFHLRAQAGAEFTGDFDADCATLQVGPVGDHAYFDVDYTRMEKVKVIGTSGLDYGPQVSVQNGVQSVLFDTVGFYDSSRSQFGGYSWGLEVIGVWVRGGSSVVFRNCAFGKFYCHQTFAARASHAYGIECRDGGNTVEVLNCAFEGLSATGGNAQYAHAVKSEGSDTVTIVNTVVGNLTGATSNLPFNIISPTAEDRQYNATMDDTGGTNSQDFITPANEFVDTTLVTLDLHMVSGGQCDGNGFNLIQGSYPNAPTEDCDGETRPTTGAWSIGIDYHNPLAEIEDWISLEGTRDDYVGLNGAQHQYLGLIGAE